MQTSQENKRTSSKKNLTIGSKYILGPKIGSGEFGQTYAVTQVQTQQIFALKRQDQKSKNSTIPLETRILKLLEYFNGFPQIKWTGVQNKYSMFIMDLLGPSLEDLFEICGRKFTLKTAIMVVDQMIERIEQLHSKNYVHRDIRPQNFLMGLNKKSHIVHLIDFALSKKYRDLKTHQHAPYKQNKNLIGTIRYASINVHLGIDQSRRDDLESIAYILMYFLQGSLPWQGIKGNSKAEKYEKILQKKMLFAIELECSSFPTQITKFISYCQSLKFDEKPNYYFLRKMLRDLLESEGHKFDYCYDWTLFAKHKKLDNGKVKLDLHGCKSSTTKSMKEHSRGQSLLNVKYSTKTEKQEQQQKSIQKVTQTEIQDSSSLFEEGEENIDDYAMQDQGSEGGVLNSEDREIDLQDKKNRLYDDDIELDEDI